MTFLKLTVRDVPLEHKTVLVRADYNVPLTAEGVISDDLRIRASLPTIKYLIEQRCKVVIMSHLGRPNGERNQAYSLAPVAQRLSELLHQPVKFVDDCIGETVAHAVKKMHEGDVVLLENLRFYPEEEEDSLSFAKKIAAAVPARYFVQDGFGVVHRAHASTSAITQCIPGVAGLLLEQEVTTITNVMTTPKHPFVAVLGGAKVSDKIKVIEAFIQKADRILIGGAMANTFLRYKNYSVGKSKVEVDQDDTIKQIYEAAKEKVGAEKIDEFIVLPQDVAVASTLDDSVRTVVPVSEIPEDAMALDIGTKTIEQFCTIAETARTVVWNGTLGISEKEPFSYGSARMALTLATRPNIISIIGGGDTADFVQKWDTRNGESFTHVSTGGGASLDLIAGKKLPGVETLLDAKK